MSDFSRLLDRMPLPYPTIIPGLRSPSDEVGGIVYFGRMLDKIRLAASGSLPSAWNEKRGNVKGSFDWRCCCFLRIDYGALEAVTLNGGTDEEILAWAFQSGRKPDEQEIEVWNGFMLKRGWRDPAAAFVAMRLEEIGLAPDTVQTMFEFIDLDEGRLTP